MDELTPDSTETRNLRQQIQAGDRQAFERLFGRHRPELRAFISLRLDPRLRTRVDPSDVVQETQMEVYRRLPDYLERQPMPFHVWLRKTAYERRAMMGRQHLRAGKRSLQREVPLLERRPRDHRQRTNIRGGCGLLVSAAQRDGRIPCRAFSERRRLAPQDARRGPRTLDRP
jgi:DNA-directed RNA polymerase specialized sigma24 family protein